MAARRANDSPGSKVQIIAAKLGRWNSDMDVTVSKYRSTLHGYVRNKPNPT